ncbi:hypothetical protein MSAN_02276100 [Mycena sanguinolenta]|uniref:Uncharacterized protein n=1 Tax=Mycena sanguinolenta TaxID=230812 RepID=A0A8H6XAT8_9AGAR|nr:hypothetical protein MSAN_02276100 [Mycena sanguinolenta]
MSGSGDDQLEAVSSGLALRLPLTSPRPAAEYDAVRIRSTAPPPPPSITAPATVATALVNENTSVQAPGPRVQRPRQQPRQHVFGFFRFPQSHFSQSQFYDCESTPARSDSSSREQQQHYDDELASDCALDGPRAVGGRRVYKADALNAVSIPPPLTSTISIAVPRIE